MKPNRRKILVGAYAAYTSAQQPEVQWQLLESLRDKEFIRGLEIPVTQKGEISSFERFSKFYPSHWQSILTCIPGTIQNLEKNPHFGLASINEEGRRAAISVLQASFQNALALNDNKSAQAIEAIEIHSAPRAGPGPKSSIGAFQKSLEEILSWSWQGIQFLIEHCDQYQEKFPMAKGFLSLEQEIEAVQKVKKGTFQFVINWGRSVLEQHDITNPARQIEILTRQNLLGGLIFSGMTSDDPIYGQWQDTHAPFDSLMDRSCVNECIELSQGVERIGFKIQALPKSMTAEQRIALIKRSADYLMGCFLS